MARTDKVIVGILVIGLVGYMSDKLFALLVDRFVKGEKDNGRN